jgi:PAS domain S-box-containing protein
MQASEPVGAPVPPGEHFRHFAESLGNLVWSARPDGFTDFYNRRFLEFLGRTLEEMQGWTWLEILHPDDLERSRRTWSEAYTAGTKYEIEYRLRRHDGRYLWHNGRASPIRDDQGRIVRWFGTCTDIEDRKRAEEALRQSEARYRDLFENANDVIYTLDLEGRITSVNRRGELTLGYTPSECFGRSAADFVAPEYHERMREALRRKLAGEASPTVYELEMIRKDGRRVVMEVSSRLIQEDGRPVGVQGIARDITERKQAEQALREADRRKDEFLAMLAHELRNPLAPIRNAALVLKLIGPSDPRIAQARDLVERQVGHLARLIDDLLDVSRITRGKILLRKERLDLVPLVRAAGEDHRALLEGAGLSLSIELPDRPVCVVGDPTRLAQVVGNLLHNALKFTEAGGCVVVRLSAGPGSAARVTVRDTGIGMGPEILAHLFEPFSQADRSLDRSRGGLGLGLALVQGLVELHGGSIRASSPGVGQGSEFVVSLPQVRGDSAPQAAPPPTLPGTKELRILIIEDNRDTAESLRMVLALAGHQVEVAYTGPEGVEKARRFGPNAVLCDIGLPGKMDGYAVARTLRADPQLCTTTLIALTGYGQEEDLRRARQAGFDQHFTKPVDPTALDQALAAVPVRRTR